jgi:hypothetical protein
MERRREKRKLRLYVEVRKINNKAEKAKTEQKKRK